jgi:surfeit locus 1 family protein
VAAFLLASVCVRLGFWQLSRMREKEAQNSRLAAALAAPPVVYRGRFDETRQVLLAGRSHNGMPGVEVVTPLLPEGGEPAVLVNRGWLPSRDGASARPQDFPETGERVVRGLAEPLARSEPAGHVGTAVAGTLRLVAADDTVRVWRTRRLVADSLALRFPYPLASFVVRELPGPGVPAEPVRTKPIPQSVAIHRSYAAQWFLFAVILTGGSVLVARSRRNPGQDRRDPTAPGAGG